MELYPLKFHPIYHEKIWGGNKIKTKLNKNYGNLNNCGESWEISAVKNNETIVSNGHLKGKTLRQIIQLYKSEIIGEKIYKQYGEEFPLLVKFIDATDDLSVQVHPDDEIAKQRHNSNGKSEIWYIMDADDNAKLISGFNKQITKKEYAEHLEAGNIKQILNFENVSKGDVFYIPAGRIHAICKGILLAEIQQTSDITYRIYDWDRIDKNGKSRELHTEQAIDAINYEHLNSYKTKYEIKQSKSEVIQTAYFNLKIIQTTEDIAIDYNDISSFVIYICVEGNAVIDYNNHNHSENISKGDVILIPYSLKKITLKTDNCKILEVTI